MYRTDFWTLWEKARVGCSERIALKQVYYQGWNGSPAKVGCMRQVLRAGALGWPRGMGWGGRQERGSGWGTHVNPWLIHINVWQKTLQYCKVISLQLIKINGKIKFKKKERRHIFKLTEMDIMAWADEWAFLKKKQDTDKRQVQTQGRCWAELPWVKGMESREAGLGWRAPLWKETECCWGLGSWDSHGPVVGDDDPDLLAPLSPYPLIPRVSLCRKG